MNRFLLLLPLFFIRLTGMSQTAPHFITESEIIGASFNSDSSLVAVMDRSNVYILNTSTLQKIKEFSHGKRFDLLRKKPEFYFHPSNDSIIVFKKPSQMLFFDSNEYPQDSLTLYRWSSDSIQSRIPGHFRFDIGRDSRFRAVVVNDFYNYTDQQGQIQHANLKGYLFTNPQKDTLIVEKGIKAVHISPNSTYLALLIYEGYEEGMRLELYTPELKLLYSDSDIPAAPVSIAFSQDEKYLGIAMREPFSPYINEYRIINLENFNQISSLTSFSDQEESDWTYQVQFGTNSEWIYSLSDHNIFIYDRNKQRIIRTFWSNLTNHTAMLKGFLVLDEDMILTLGLQRNEVGMSMSSGVIERVDLEELRAYTNTQEIIKTPLFQQDSVFLQTSSFSGEYGTSIIPFLNREFLAVTGENVFSLWNIPQKRKLHEFDLKNNFQLFPGFTPGRFFVYEDFHPRTYSGFSLHQYNIDSNFRETKYFIPEEGEFGYLNAPLIMLPMHDSTQRWLASDGSQNLFIYQTEERDFRKLTKSKFERIEQIIPYSPAQWLVSGVTKKGRNEVHLFHSKDLRFTPLFSTENTVKLSYTNKTCRIIEQETGTVYEVNKEKLNQVLDLGVPVQSVWLQNDWVIIEDESGSIQYKTRKSPSWNETEIDGYDYYWHNNNELIYAYSSLKSVQFPLIIEDEWSTVTPEFLSFDPFDVSRDGSQLLIGNLIDLNELKIDLSNARSEWISSREHDLHLFLNQNQLGTKYVVDETGRNNSYKGHDEMILMDSEGRTIHASKKLVDDATPSMIKSKDETYFFEYEWTAVGTKKERPAYLRNANDLTIIKTFREDFSSASFSTSGNTLILREKEGFMNEAGNTILYDLSSNKKKNIEGYIISDLIHEGQAMVTNFVGNIVTYELTGTDSVQEISSYFSRNYLSTSCYIPYRNWIAAGSQEGKIIIWDVDSPGSPIHEFNSNGNQIVKLQSTDKQLYSIDETGEVWIWDLEIPGEYVRIKPLIIDGEIKLFWDTHDGYYWSDKSLLKYFHFVNQQKIYPFSSFDLWRNRPDIILSRLGIANEETIQLYRKAWEKRVKKAGFTIGSNRSLFQQPAIEIINKREIPGISTSRSLEVQWSAKAQGSPLSSVKIMINGVPVWESTPNREQQTSQNTQITLLPGKNTITITATDENGMISPADILDVTYQPQQLEKPVLYYIGVGVSEYENTQMNLNYAAKDVKDLSSLLSDISELEVKIDTLLNQQATREQILELKNRLKETQPEDMVILSFSGHGLLTQELDFYFASHDTDFQSPQNSAISYRELEWLLEGIPARRKLLLLDACNSGEADPESTLAQSSVPQSVAESITFRGDQTGSTLSYSNAFALMQELFGDVTQNSGAFVISAASSNEYAYETSELKNGVFTYSLMDGLRKTKTADGIQLSKLKKYVDRKVVELTQGKQRPTSRIENLSWDWFIR